MSDKTTWNEKFCQEQPKLLLHLEAVLEQNRKQNLTSIKTIDAGKVFHIEDSLAVLPEVNGAPAGLMADIGSGAGYPGIPLALVSGRQTALVESQQNKARFLEHFLALNDLADQISVYACRTEELAREQGETFSVITARAVAELPVLLELAAPLLSSGGHFIALKGRQDATELERGATVAGLLGFELESTRCYAMRFEEAEYQRSVYVYKKTGDSSVVLPRRPGMATKRPLA